MRAREAADALAGCGMGSPDVAFVLGSGLAEALYVPPPSLVVGFDEIPGFPETSVRGHPGRIVAGKLHGVELLVVQGRFHLR